MIFSRELAWTSADMKFALNLLNCFVLRVLWICHEAYDYFLPMNKEIDKPKDERTPRSSRDDHSDKRHFIHLYTTSSVNNKRPTCYMDVYEIFSPLEEQQLRDVCSKGVPNKTYLKYNQKRLAQRQAASQAFGWNILV